MSLILVVSFAGVLTPGISENMFGSLAHRCIWTVPYMPASCRNYQTFKEEASQDELKIPDNVYCRSHLTFYTRRTRLLYCNDTHDALNLLNQCQYHHIKYQWARQGKDGISCYDSIWAKCEPPFLLLLFRAYENIHVLLFIKLAELMG